ncbi:hypothetical protein KDL01_28170 [Actinospica durhamensis]|uniref:FtsK domain-containing protein n=1 Tax=Actinospica durhamensis TaxID=1508375 RepID=A0A941EUD8_9ACTN|nr:FtsK/SpoIIIE domain-containing protein [Actinospica durhamensis]MBR7837186.1 hypothetical protein [Actinospica durhamensis]
MHTLTNPGFWFLVLVTVWLAAGVVLKGRSPVGHWYLVGYPVTWARINWTWRPLAVERGLSLSRSGGRALVGDLVVRGQDLRPMVPRIWISRPRRDGLSVRVRMLPGQTPEQYAQAAEAIMHAWRVEQVRVTSPSRGIVVVTAMMTDPLAGVITRDPQAGPVPADGPGDRPVLALLVGITEAGKSWIMNLRLVPHWLIIGATRSGKSTLIHAMVTRLAPHAVALVGVDLKGGLELSVYAPRLSGLATTREEAAEIFAALLDEVMDRMNTCRVAGVRATWELPYPVVPIIILIDEIAELFLLTNPKDRDEIALRDKVVTTLLRLAQLGAALDVHVIAGGQRFGSELGPLATALRAGLSGRICMHVNDPESAQMVLGDVWPEAVAQAQRITATEQGTAVTADGLGSWTRARATLTDPAEAAAAARLHASLTPVLAGMTRPQVGEVS